MHSIHNRTYATWTNKAQTQMFPIDLFEGIPSLFSLSPVLYLWLRLKLTFPKITVAAFHMSFFFQGNILVVFVNGFCFLDIAPTLQITHATNLHRALLDSMTHCLFQENVIFIVCKM